VIFFLDELAILFHLNLHMFLVSESLLVSPQSRQMQPDLLIWPQILIADFPEVQEKIGSSGRTRTYNPPVNSRFLPVGVYVVSMT